MAHDQGLKKLGKGPILAAAASELDKPGQQKVESAERFQLDRTSWIAKKKLYHAKRKHAIIINNELKDVCSSSSSSLNESFMTCHSNPAC